MAKPITGLDPITSPNRTDYDIAIESAVDPAEDTKRFPLSSLTGNNVVIVNTEDDLPDAVSSVRTLEAKTYLIVGSFSTADELVLIAGTSIVGYAAFSAGMVYTGSGTFITATNACTITGVSLTAATGTLFDFSLTNVGDFVSLINIIIPSALDVGSFNGISFQLQNVFIVSYKQGFQCTGSINIGLAKDVRAIDNDASAILMDLGTAVFNQIDFEDWSVNGTGTALSGAASSANLSTGSLGRMLNCNLGGITTKLSGIQKTDIRWRFNSNVGIPDSFDAAEGDMEVPETVTISATNTYYLVDGGNWVDSVAERFSLNTDGEATFLGESPEEFLVISNTTLEKVGGGADTICTRIAIDTGGGYVTESASTGCTQNSQPTQVTSKKIVELNEGDKVAVFVANEDSTADVIVDLCNLTITRIP